MEKINLVELLKNCPTGMELDCTVFDNVTFDYVNTQQNRVYCKVGGSESVWFTPKGGVNLFPSAKCVIFPKGKTTWEGFVPPCKFKDGDIVFTNQGSIAIIYHKVGLSPDYLGFCGLFSNEFDTDVVVKPKRIATEEEKQKLFDEIKENGYKWNAETKTLEKLVPNKFDITTLKLFDKVLYRVRNSDVWHAGFYNFYKNNSHYIINNDIARQCIPYEGNEHLLGTTDDCDEY